MDINNKSYRNKIINTNYYYDTNNNTINKRKDDDKFTYPKYYNNLKRIYSFYKSKKRGESPKAKKIYDTIIPDIEQCKSLNELIVELNNDNYKNNKFINNLDLENNNDNINQKDYINEIGEFVKYDKNLSNSIFIKNKLKGNNELKEDHNIFDVINIVDDEYNNLVNGKYCCKCGYELIKCKCDDVNCLFKESEQDDENHKSNEEDEFLDFESEENIKNKKKINYFEYESNKSKGLIIGKKPKINEYMIEQPIKKILIYNKRQIQDINKSINEKNKKNLNKSSEIDIIKNDFNNISFTNHRYSNNNNFISNLKQRKKNHNYK